MNKRLICTTMTAGMIFFAAGHAVAGDRGDVAERWFDRRGDRINERLDRAAEQAADNAKEQRAGFLDRKGNREDAPDFYAWLEATQPNS